MFEGVFQWLSDGVHVCVDVGVGQCTRHNLHRTNHIEIYNALGVNDRGLVFLDTQGL